VCWHHVVESPCDAATRSRLRFSAGREQRTNKLPGLQAASSSSKPQCFSSSVGTYF
jgi:hypothetical protein